MLKQLARKIIARAGYELVRPSLKTKPINVLELALSQMGLDLFFIEIGGHDGVMRDPIFEMDCLTNGIVVEPQPDIFQTLKQNYSNRPWVDLENCAIADQDGQMNLHRFALGQGLPKEATMLASFNRNSITQNGHGWKGEIESVPVPTMRFETFLKKHRVQRIDLLQVDTEGYDFSIVRQALSQPLLPRIIHFENAFINANQANELAGLFNKHGYATANVGIDTVAIKEADPKAFSKFEKFDRNSISSVTA